MMGVAFAFHLSTDTVAFLKRLLPSHFVTADVVLVPFFGTFGYLLGATLSLVGGHLAIALHRDAIAYDIYSRELAAVGPEGATGTVAAAAAAPAAAAASELREARDPEILTPPAPAPAAASFDASTSSGSPPSSPSGAFLGPSTAAGASPGVNARATPEPLSAPSWVSFGVNETNRYIRESVSAHMHKCKGTMPQVCGCGSRAAYKGVIELVVLLSLVVSLSATVYGSFADTFGFEFKGLVGKLVGAIDPRQVKSDWSLVDMIKGMGIGNGESAGIVMLQVLLGFLACVAPVVHLLSLAAIWWIPLTLTEQKWLYAVTEALGAWAGLDVYLFGVVSALLQMPMFARYLVGATCSQVLPPSVDCFDVEAYLLDQFAVVVVAVTSWYVAAFVVMRFADHSILHREAFFALH
jgi:hypothetical protein